MSGSPETIHERGRAAVLAGAEKLDVAPYPGLPRWGLSLVVRPDPDAERRLAALTAQAAEHAGPGQWPTGDRGSAHLTVCYLEPEHREVDADDAAVTRAAGALRPLATGTAPLAWNLVGVGLADRGVLALAAPVDEHPDAFRTAVLDALGDLGRAEARYRRTVWWSTLVHFAAPVADRAALVRWADELADAPLGRVTARSVDVVRYEHQASPTGPRTVPVTLASLAVAAT